MRFFNHLLQSDEEIFYETPNEFTKYSDKSILSYCVGAALYMPAIRKTIAQEIIDRKHPTITTIVLDLEDALGDLQVRQGENQVNSTLSQLQMAIQQKAIVIEELPLIFIRVRSINQLKKMIGKLGSLQHLLTGYVIPKFHAKDGALYLEEIQRQNEIGYTLYAMPILESKEILFGETRQQELLSIREILLDYEAIILNVRIGSTDFCGLFGIRRTIEHTVYDLVTIQQCLADIMNVFLRAEPSFVVSGPVCEYFGTTAAKAILMKEVELDRLNGLVGKTIIHPEHILPVQFLQAVSHEEYVDALAIILCSTGQIGVSKSDYGNKMNEMKPHFLWAQRILLKAQVYGVLQEGYSPYHLLHKQVAL